MAAPVRYQEGSATITTTEYSFANASTTLATKTDIGVYTLQLDTNAFANGDVYLVQVYEAGKSSGGTKRVIDSWLFEGPSGKPANYLPSTGGLLLGNGWDWTIKKVSGVDKSVDFTLWRVT